MLIEKQADVNAKDKNGNTPLHLAAYYGHVEAIKWLIRRGSNKNKKNNCGETPLHMAAKNNKDLAIEALINTINLNRCLPFGQSVNLNAGRIGGATPLHIAAAENSSMAIRELIKQKADVNAIDIEYKTPLFVAVENGHVETVKLLIGNRKTNVNKENMASLSAINIAVRNNNRELVQILFEAGGKLDKYQTTSSSFCYSAIAKKVFGLTNSHAGLTEDMQSFINNLNEPKNKSARDERLAQLRNAANTSSPGDSANSVAATMIFSQPPPQHNLI